MTTYYHGTLSRHEQSIRKHGICQPNVCPVPNVGLSQSYPCDVNAIYVANTASKAAYFAYLLSRGHESVSIYKVATKYCKREDDVSGNMDVGDGTFRLTKCDCLKPIKRCELKDREQIQNYLNWKAFMSEDLGSTSPEPRLSCKWEQV